MEKDYVNGEIDIKDLIFIMVKNFKLIIYVILLTTLLGSILAFFKGNIKFDLVISIVISIILGIMISGFLVFIKESYKKNINFKIDIQRGLNLELLGVIPKINEKTILTDRFIFESYNYVISKFHKNYKAVTFTSPGPGEGTTTSVVNLALALADIGKKVVILDCNLRKPDIHNYFNINNENGIIDLIKQGNIDQSFIKKTNYNNLFFVNAGILKDNPLTILEQPLLDELIAFLKANFDYILIDTPPISVVTDALILSKKSDATILVCASEESNYQMAKRSVEILNDTNLIGAILTKVSKFNPELNFIYQESVYYKS